MTEMSPLGTVARPAGRRPRSEELALPRRPRAGSRPASRRASSGRTAPSMPWDGKSVGELEVRGPVDHQLLLRLRLRHEPSGRRRSKFSTTAGCAPVTSASLTPDGYLTLTDRAKDVIKSGGEWISSVDLENALMAHPTCSRPPSSGVPDEQVGRASTRHGRAPGRDGRRRRPSCATSSAARSRAGSCPSAGRSSRRCRRPRRQVRQEGDPRAVRRGRPAGRDPGLAVRPHRYATVSELDE